MATEVTSLGAHTDLWRPKEGRLSSLVERQGWTRLFPPIRRAWETLGRLRPEIAAETGLSPEVRVICGAHDSNASLVPYLASRSDPFTVLSTGTWVIILAVGGKAPIDREGRHARQCRRARPPGADGAPHARARVRRAGGRNARRGASRPTSPRSSPRASMALPAFTDQGGPFAGRKGRIEGEAPTTPAARAALATLYCALMTAHMLKLLEAPGDLIVEGGFNRSPAFAGVLAALMPGRDVLAAPASGAAEGAALLAHWDEKHAPPKLRRADAWSVPGLRAYQERWEADAVTGPRAVLTATPPPLPSFAASPCAASIAPSTACGSDGSASASATLSRSSLWFGSLRRNSSRSAMIFAVFCSDEDRDLERQLVAAGRQFVVVALSDQNDRREDRG